MYPTTVTPGHVALRIFRDLALEYPDDFSMRYGWPEHTQPEVESFWDEAIAKIPGTATKVLDAGCGGGLFAQRLLAARPGIKVHGVDLVPENIASAEALGLGADATFEVGSVWEVLAAGGDWDYVVSFGCLFHYTDGRYNRDLFHLLDAAAPQGFFAVVAVNDWLRDLLVPEMEAIIAASSGVTASYVTGVRDFMDASLMKGLQPFFINRAGTSTAKPDLPVRVTVMRDGRYATQLVHQEVAYRDRKGLGRPTDIDLPVVSAGGRITSFAARNLAEVLGE